MSDEPILRLGPVERPPAARTPPLTVLLSRTLRRPELGAFSATVFVFLFFVVTAAGSGMFSPPGIVNFLAVSAQLGILAAAVSLLMIGGEFDLSLGSTIGFSGIIIGIGVVKLGLPISVAVLIAFLVAVVIGAINGLLVTRSGLPSFIVTLASYFALRGLSLVITRMLTGRTQIPYITKDSSETGFIWLFGGKFGTSFLNWLAEVGWFPSRADGLASVQGLPISIAWWVALTVLGSWVLLRTSFGNWIFAVGGDVNAARKVGVPVEWVKIMLFIGSALAATLFATIQVLETGSADVLRGAQKEFEAVIAAVIGGNLLTGGYGSVVGAMLGALIFGTIQMGIFYTGADNDWFMVFLGMMILLAVLLNDYVRRKAMELR